MDTVTQLEDVQAAKAAAVMDLPLLTFALVPVRAILISFIA